LFCFDKRANFPNNLKSLIFEEYKGVWPAHTPGEQGYVRISHCRALR